jgi:hypothetical protein
MISNGLSFYRRVRVCSAKVLGAILLRTKRSRKRGKNRLHACSPNSLFRGYTLKYHNETCCHIPRCTWSISVRSHSRSSPVFTSTPHSQ